MFKKFYSGLNHEVTTKPLSFAAISEHLDHGAHATWAHLAPIRQFIENKLPKLTIIHFHSRPTSQNRNKANVFLMMTHTHQINRNNTSASWNYSEPAHGKG